MGVSLNSGTPKSSILIGLSIINHPFWGTPIFGNTHIKSINPFLRSFPLDIFGKSTVSSKLRAEHQVAKAT